MVYKSWILHFYLILLFCYYRVRIYIHTYICTCCLTVSVSYLFPSICWPNLLASKRSLRTFHDLCPIGRPIHSTTASRVGEGGHTLIELLHLVTTYKECKHKSCYYFYFSPPFCIVISFDFLSFDKRVIIYTFISYLIRKQDRVLRILIL